MASALARDFLHTEALGDAILKILQDELPEEIIEELKLLAFGDIHEYVARGQNILDDTPVVFVKPIAIVPFSSQAMGGMMTVERFRIIMVRSFDETFNDDGDIIPAARGRARYAKILNKAIFTSERLNIPELSTADQSAHVKRIRLVEWDLNGNNEDTGAIMEMVAELWAISCDIDVELITGPRGD